MEKIYALKSTQTLNYVEGIEIDTNAMIIVNTCDLRGKPIISKNKEMIENLCGLFTKGDLVVVELKEIVAYEEFKEETK